MDCYIKDSSNRSTEQQNATFVPVPLKALSSTFNQLTQIRAPYRAQYEQIFLLYLASYCVEQHFSAAIIFGKTVQGFWVGKILRLSISN